MIPRSPLKPVLYRVAAAIRFGEVMVAGSAQSERMQPASPGKVLRRKLENWEAETSGATIEKRSEGNDRGHFRHGRVDLFAPGRARKSVPPGSFPPLPGIPSQLTNWLVELFCRLRVSFS